MYPIEIRLASKNGWYTPDEARRYYGKYSREGITIHWWNSPNLIKDSDHDNIVNYMLGNATKGAAPTVNYVLSNNKITLVVNPDNVAWASGNGNATTVSVECSPHLNAEGYKKAGWLINELEGRYGRVLKLFKHSDWMSTQCPGTLDINRMRSEANKWKSGGYNHKPVPEPQPVPIPPTPTQPVIDEWVLWKEGAIEYVCNKQPTHLWNFNSASWNMQSVKQFNKGDRVTIVGHAHNSKLDRDYYVTEYSFTKKITNGFNPSDLDVYVPPRPQPEPPKEEDQKPPEPPKPNPNDKDKEQDGRLDAIEALLKKIVDFLKSIFTGFKGV